MWQPKLAFQFTQQVSDRLIIIVRDGLFSLWHKTLFFFMILNSSKVGFVTWNVTQYAEPRWRLVVGEFRLMRRFVQLVLWSVAATLVAAHFRFFIVLRQEFNYITQSRPILGTGQSVSDLEVAIIKFLRHFLWPAISRTCL